MKEPLKISKKNVNFLQEISTAWKNEAQAAKLGTKSPTCADNQWNVFFLLPSVNNSLLF